ncbi:uncharacterized protein TOT_010000226 [Theileria orientalis strain Shintoku]|uniref:Cleavage/polyadenylation specificity factor A subunit C-terminal domain-containing protein n=1 Tax=Theileria orientalis strain Shintoku TaxID=869250 RepID=J7MEV5_THEOR|nr:uncharacterized protein TOT_010000226 [Theileria orientalis strain Shintoku]BAM38759.1 uncharacterized protein TOT_010000226 [Theileria orientalis strain Shintoku]|eukprot:XP_009689060.1 uncharacterized protein TOT_010000226 [Theileria orientalis strain Shintoku]
MYTYFVTAATSCSIIKSIKCRLIKDSTAEYLVCLKSNSIEVYTLPEDSEESNSPFDSGPNPCLITSLHSYFTFLTCIEYRPPNHNQSYLLVLTQNYTLILLKFDSENCKFVSKNVACLQEPFSGVRCGNVILKIDAAYNLIVFCGHTRIIKCIVLNKSDYFNFSDIITMRTNDSFFLDFEFMSVEYKSEDSMKVNIEGESRSYSNSLSQELQFKSPNRNSSIHQLECKLLVLGQDDSDSKSEPARWLYGMHLSFEIELLNGHKRFNSYSNVPLFGDPVKLSSPFSKFVPLSLNSTSRNDSTLMLGSGSVAYTSFKAPKEVRSFKLDVSMTEVSCYARHSTNKYLFADDNGNVYIMDLLLSTRNEGTGLKRRVGPSVGAKSVQATKREGELVVRDVKVERVGSCAIPSSIVKLDEERIFCTSRHGNSATMRIKGAGDKRSRIQSGRVWAQANVGPVTDFTYLQEEESDGSILACCGSGTSGSFCKIYFGIGSEVLYSKELRGVHNLFGLHLQGREESEGHLVMCISFYRFTRFYLVSQAEGEARDKGGKSNSLELLETKLSEIVKLEREELITDETTLLFSRFNEDCVLQVTPLNVLVAAQGFKKVTRVSVSELARVGEGPDFTVSALVCGRHILLLLASNTVLLLDHELKVVNRKKMGTSVSSISYISKGDLTRSSFRASSVFKQAECEGILAATGWDSEIMIMPLLSLEVVYKYRCSIGFGTFVKSLKFGMVGPEVYLLASVSDGKLYTYKFKETAESGDEGPKVKIEPDNIVELSDGSFKLLDVQLGRDDETCDLRTRKLITTGSKCSIIHASNNKIEYTKVNVSNLWALATLSNKWYSNNSNGGTSDKMKHSSASTGKTNRSGSANQYSSGTFLSNSDEETLVVYYTNKSIVVGTLDFVKNLNVKRIVTGANMNKIAYHSGSKLAVVSTIPQYVVNPNELSNVEENENRNNVRGADELQVDKVDLKREPEEARRGGTKRTIHEEPEQYQNIMVCTEANELLESTNDAFIPSCLLFVDVESSKIVHKLEVPEGHVVSSLRTYIHEHVEYVAVGSSLVSEQSDLPAEGHLYLVEIDRSRGSLAFKVQRTSEPFEGGVVDIAVMDEMLVLAVNATLMIVKLGGEHSVTTPLKDKNRPKSGRVGDQGGGAAGSRGGKAEKKNYKLEYVQGCAEECTRYLELITSYESNTYIVAVDVCEDSVFLGDLMTSVKLLKFKDKCLYESCRDFNTLWTSSLAAVDASTCLVADDSGNFSVFAKSKTPVNDHKAIKFDTLGLFHHGETVNRIVKRRRAVVDAGRHLKIASKLGQKRHACERLFCCQGAPAGHERFKMRERSSLFDATFTCCTSSGSFLQLCVFSDVKLFLRLSLLEQTLQLFHSHTGVNLNKNYRNFENLHTTVPPRGFVDGDLVERFLRLPQAAKLRVFESFRKNAQELDLDCSTLDQLVATVENVTNSRLM